MGDPYAIGQQAYEMAPVQVPGQDIFGNGPIEVHQVCDLFEELTGCEAKNRYRIKGAAAGDMYVFEESDCCERIFCGPQRTLTLHLVIGVDKRGPKIMSMHKPCHIAHPWACCMRPEMNLTDANGAALGKIKDPCRCCTMDQQAYNSGGDHIFTAAGSICQLGIICPCCDEVRFDVTNVRTGKNDGQIKKLKMGCKECLTGANDMAIAFPSGTNVNEKSLLIGMLFLIDLQYFEAKERNG